METSNRIRLQQLVADPKAYIAEMFQLHPDATHDEESGAIAIKNDLFDSSFRYSVLEEGLFLFVFSSFSPIDAEYTFIPNPNSEYYTLVFYYTEEKSKNPLYLKFDDTFYSNDQFSLFFNGQISAEIFIKAKHRAHGLRLDIHKQWIKNNLSFATSKKISTLQNIIEYNTKSYIQIDCNTYSDLVNKIETYITTERHVTQKLKLKTYAYDLIQQYFENIIQQPQYTQETLQDIGALEIALNYMAKNFCGEFPGIDTLAKLCNLSESAFNKKFKNAFNQSPANHFTELKMKEALRLLHLGENVKKIAHKVGYKDASAFGRAFKHQYGQSPASYITK